MSLNQTEIGKELHISKKELISEIIVIIITLTPGLYCNYNYFNVKRYKKLEFHDFFNTVLQFNHIERNYFSFFGYF